MKLAKRNVLLVLLAAITLSACSATTGQLSDFKTDGCSLFPDGTLMERNKWHDCCVVHDVAYWQGGTSQQRKQADLKLEQCVAATGEPVIAKFMLLGVRLGGVPWLPTWYRWGFGWDGYRSYDPLTPEEQAKVQAKMPTVP